MFVNHMSPLLIHPTNKICQAQLLIHKIIAVDGGIKFDILLDHK